MTNTSTITNSNHDAIAKAIAIEITSAMSQGRMPRVQTLLDNPVMEGILSISEGGFFICAGLPPSEDETEAGETMLAIDREMSDQEISEALTYWATRWVSESPTGRAILTAHRKSGQNRSTRRSRRGR